MCFTLTYPASGLSARRLVELGALREPTGRDSFRLYGIRVLQDAQSQNSREALRTCRPSSAGANKCVGSRQSCSSAPRRFISTIWRGQLCGSGCSESSHAPFGGSRQRRQCDTTSAVETSAAWSHPTCSRHSERSAVRHQSAPRINL